MESATDLAHKTIKSSTWNLAAFAWPIIFSVFVTPIIVHRLHVQAYGVLVLVNTILSILALMELGLGASLLKTVSEESIQDNFVALEPKINAVLTLNFLVGIIGAVIMVILGTAALSWFQIPASDLAQTRTVFFIGALIFFSNSLANTFLVIPQAMQRYDLTAKISIIGTAFGNLLAVGAVLLNYKLVTILAIQLLQVIGMTISYVFFAKTLLPKLRWRLRFSWSGFLPVAHFGTFVFIKNISTQALTYLDRIIVSAFLGPVAVSFYSLPGNVTIKTVGIAGSITDIFFPLTSQMSAAGDRTKINVIYKRVIRNILLISAAATCAIIMFGRKILLYWLGPEFVANSIDILYLLAVTHFLLAWYMPVTNFLLGVGAVKLLAFSSLAMFVLDVLFLIGLLPHFQLIGAGWAYLLAVLPVPLIIVFAERRYLQISDNWRFYFKIALKLIIVSVAYYILAHWFLVPLAVNVYALVFIGPASVLIYLLLYKLLGFMPSEDWLTFKGFASNIKNRIFPYGKSA